MYSYVEALNKVVQTHDFDVPAAVKLSPGYIGIGMAQASSKVTNYDRGFLSWKGLQYYSLNLELFNILFQRAPASWHAVHLTTFIPHVPG